MFVGAILFARDIVSDWRAVWPVLVSAGVLVGLALGFLLEAPIMGWRARLLARLKSATSARGQEPAVSRPAMGPTGVRTASPC
jgi:hypothetical protein